ncbi:FAD-binding oxidoreductase [Candidatus Thorarchaeota archaeon]|nr:MAG: FAD-binding oxidoreductase [Candidatus Thorarchaeota archaeon]
MDQKIVSELAAIVGDDYVSTREDVLLTYSHSASIGYDGVMPGAVVRPANTQEVSEVLQVANKYKIAVTPRSGGSSLQGEVIPREGGLVVELMRLDEITLFKKLRSVRVGAGVTFGMLDKYLNQYDLWVPIYPESSLVCTLAGNVAVNGAGPGSSSYGCIAEMVLGLEVVLPDGTIIQTGSEANPDAPGPFLRYAFGPDITGLFIGSLGALGIITRVSVKTFKRIRNFHYETYGFETAEQAERFLLELRENDVQAVFASIYEGRILEFFMDMLGEEYGIPKYEWPTFTVSVTLGRLREDQLASDVEKAAEICEKLGGHVIGISELPRGEWDDRMRTFARSSYAHGWHWRILYHHQTPTNWHRSVETIWDVMDEFGLLGHTAGFLTGHSSYNFYPHLYFDPEDAEEEEKVRAAHAELSKRLFKTGAVPFKLAPYWLEDVPEMDRYLRFIHEIKNLLDPNGIMNPGVIPMPE